MNHKTPHVVLLCATNRGLRCLQKIRKILPDARLTVFSFREDPWEPPYLESIKCFCDRYNCEFIECKKLDTEPSVEDWKDSPPDLMLAISWRYMVPRDIFRLPVRGSFVFHDSFLQS